MLSTLKPLNYFRLRQDEIRYSIGPPKFDVPVEDRVSDSFLKHILEAILYQITRRTPQTLPEACDICNPMSIVLK